MTQLTHDQFLSERHKAIDARARIQQSIERFVTGGAAGALILSVTFLGQLTPAKIAGSALILSVSWLLLLLSLGLSLCANFESWKAFDAYIQELDDAYSNRRACKPVENEVNRALLLLRTSIFTLLLGIGGLALFAILNI